MAGIFISYRRADSDGWAGRLRDTLRARFGNRVFQDVESIADGEIFSEVIDRALQECDVALIIIGPNWASARDDTGRRLDQTADWVRTETSLVLNRKIRVIPVLVGGASMPRPEDLPEDLRSLTRRQAREIRSNSWDSDVALLTSHLKQIVGSHKRPAWQYAVATVVVWGGIGAFAGSRYFGQPATAPAERTAASPAGASIQQEAAAPAPAVVPSPKIAASDTPKEKPPESVPPPKVKPQPEPPVAAVTPVPSTATAAPVKPAPAPLRQAERDQPTARPAPPPVKARAEASPPERRKPAAVQAEAPPDRTAAATPTPPAAVPKPAPQPAPAPAAAPAVVAHAALNLPNRPAAARELKVGDSWTYRLREMRLDRNLATVTHEIGGGDKSGIREVVRLGARKPDADPGESTAGTQRRLPLEPRIFEQSLGQNAALFEFSPFMTAFSELQPGVTWSKIAGATSPDSVNDWRFNGKVTGRERVRVPAGSFDAIKAELEGQVDLSSPLTRDPYGDTTVSYQTYTVWFVPEIGRAIKYERRTFNRVRRLLEHEQYELMSYRLN